MKIKIVEMESIFENRVTVRRLRMDNGGAYVLNKLDKWFRDKFFAPKYSPPYSSEKNRRSEFLNRTLLSKTQEMTSALGEKKMGLWAENIYTASYIRGRLYHAECQRAEKTPDEAVTEIRLDVRHIRLFGSREFLRISKQSCWEKLGNQARL